jgi:hypothetical protein
VGYCVEHFLWMCVLKFGQRVIIFWWTLNPFHIKSILVWNLKMKSTTTTTKALPGFLLPFYFQLP